MAYPPFDINTPANKGSAWAARLLATSPKSNILNRLISKIEQGVVGASMQNAVETIFYGDGVFDANTPINISSFRAYKKGWMNKNAISNVIREAIYAVCPESLIGEIRMYDVDDIVTWVTCDDSHALMPFANDGLVLNPCVLPPNPYLLVEKTNKLRFDSDLENLWQTLEGINIFLDDKSCNETYDHLSVGRNVWTYPNETLLYRHINERSKEYCKTLFRNTKALKTKCACFPTFVIRHVETKDAPIYVSPSHIKITDKNIVLAYSIDKKEFRYKNNNPKITFRGMHSYNQPWSTPDTT